MVAGSELNRGLLRYKSWANDLLFKSLEGTSTATLEAQHPIVLVSIIRTLHHTYAMDAVWQAHLQGEAHSYTSRNPPACPAFKELQLLQGKLHAWYCDYAAKLPPAQVTSAVEFEFIGGGAGRMTKEETLLHVVNHATYHRGHVSNMMYNAKLTPPTTDLPIYLQQ